MEVTKKDAPIVRTFSEYLPEPFIDEVSADEKYYGWAPMGTAETDNGWRIMKETKELLPRESTLKEQWTSSQLGVNVILITIQDNRLWQGILKIWGRLLVYISATLHLKT